MSRCVRIYNLAFYIIQTLIIYYYLQNRLLELIYLFFIDAYIYFYFSSIFTRHIILLQFLYPISVA